MYSYVPVSLVCLFVMFSALSSLSRSVWGDVWRRTAALELLWQCDHFSRERVCDQSNSELCLSRPLSHCISVITYIIRKRLSTGSLGLSQCLLSLFFLSLGRWQKLGSKETDWAQWRARAAGTSIVGRGRGLRNTILSLPISLSFCAQRMCSLPALPIISLLKPLWLRWSVFLCVIIAVTRGAVLEIHLNDKAGE